MCRFVYSHFTLDNPIIELGVLVDFYAQPNRFVDKVLQQCVVKLVGHGIFIKLDFHPATSKSLMDMQLVYDRYRQFSMTNGSFIS